MASNGAEAMALAAQHTGRIDIIITPDIRVMPGLNGREVVERLSPMHPEAKVLFMSGSGDTVLRLGILESKTPFMQKPFSAIALARKVRELLAGDSEKGSRASRPDIFAWVGRTLAADGDLPPHYQPALVVASFVVACLAGYTALTLAARVAATRRQSWRTTWLIAGALVMGSGIWGMHFIGMLALELPVPVTYNALEVGLSVLVAIAASTLALTVASGPALGRRRLAVAGAALGAAIVGMHYTGMAALLRYGGRVGIRHAAGFALSILVAVVAAVVGLQLAFRSRNENASGARFPGIGRLAAGVVIGVAISRDALHRHGGRSVPRTGQCRRCRFGRPMTSTAGFAVRRRPGISCGGGHGAATTRDHCGDAHGTEPDPTGRRCGAGKRASATCARGGARAGRGGAYGDPRSDRSGQAASQVGIIEATSDLVTIGAMPEGRCVYMNRAGRRLLKISGAEHVSA